MEISIVSEPLMLSIFGFSGTAVDKDYVGTALKLMDRMWSVIKSNGVSNNGRNIWVYGPNDSVFTGVEMEFAPPRNFGLEERIITLPKYACHKHIGPYHLLRQVGQAMEKELKNRGLERTHPYLEVYGHPTADDAKLETELMMCLK